MSDRLNELQRQRALIQGHLAWLDQEIAAASSGPEPDLATTTSARSATSVPIAVSQDTDALIAQFAVDPKGASERARRGCFIFFGLALVLLGLAVFGLFRYSRSLHPDAPSEKVKTTQGTPANR